MMWLSNLLTCVAHVFAGCSACSRRRGRDGNEGERAGEDVVLSRSDIVIDNLANTLQSACRSHLHLKKSHGLA